MEGSAKGSGLKRKREDSSHKRSRQRHSKRQRLAGEPTNGVHIPWTERPTEEQWATRSKHVAKDQISWGVLTEAETKGKTKPKLKKERTMVVDSTQRPQMAEGIDGRKKKKRTGHKKKQTVAFGYDLPEEQDVLLNDKWHHASKPNGTIHKDKRGRRAQIETMIPAISRVQTGSGAIGNTADSGQDAWVVSSPTAGRYIDTRPLFSRDEKHVILATEAAVHVFSTSTSLLLHSLTGSFDINIAAYALADAKSEILYSGGTSGTIEAWNWMQRKRLGSWETEAPVFDIAVAPTAEASTELVYAIHSSNEQWRITAYRLDLDGDLSVIESSTVLKHNHPIIAMKVLNRGEIIVAITGNSALVGKAKTLSVKSNSELKFSWREIYCTEPIASFDARVSPKTDRASHKFKKAKEGLTVQSQDVLNIVLGGIKGCIYLYQDLLNRLIFEDMSGKSVGPSTSVSPQELHWHRESVGAVAWSKDGNYIISGGKETVLVLWQLDTGKKQFLPNLESPIQSITVSPAGSSYAVRLGDNSVMVLSTSELEPTSNFPGLQTQSLAEVHKLPRLPTVGLRDQILSETGPLRATAAISPQNPSTLLLAVPASQATSDDYSRHVPTPYLQTFDISTSRHISRQALTRTNAINTDLGPGGNKIQTPNVTSIQISCDGQWLATVDEWIPPEQDLEDLGVDNEDILAAIDDQRDVSLKFWSWDDSNQHWALNSRIVTPHPSEGSQACCRIFNLAASPMMPSFATIGADSCIRTWTLKSSPLDNTTKRRESSKGAKDAMHEPDVREYWSQGRALFVEKDIPMEFLQTPVLKNAILAYSNDGSVIAAYQSFAPGVQNQDIVHFIDADYCTLRESRSGLEADAGELVSIGFLDRYLICLGTYGIAVWNVVSFDLVRYYSLDSAPQAAFTSHLAINLPSFTFAVASPQLKASASSRALQTYKKNSLSKSKDLERLQHTLEIIKNTTCHLQVFSPTALLPVAEATTSRPPIALLSASGLNSDKCLSNDLEVQKQAFVLIDTGASIRTIKPRFVTQNDMEEGERVNGSIGSSSDDQPPEVAPTPEDPPDEEDLTRHTALETISDGVDGALDGIIEPAHRAVVRPEQLAELFDYPAPAMPPLKTMFESVLRLYAGRPQKPLDLQRDADEVAATERARYVAADDSVASEDEDSDESEDSEDSE